MTMVIQPHWPAPKNIFAGTTTKWVENIEQLNFPEIPVMIKQVHGSRVLNVNALNHEQKKHEADAVVSSEFNQICAVETADCLPILICDEKGEWVSAVHAGWKGICAGVIENTLNTLPVERNQLIVWIGPSISQKNYEVGDDMRSQFTHHKDDDAFEKISDKPHKYLCDLSILARNRLCLSHVELHQIFSENYCTYSNKELFYSYRRDGTQKGRLLSFIWRGEQTHEFRTT
jgi:YfiH family protein